MPWGSGGFGSSGFGASFDNVDTGSSSHSSGWGNSGFSSGNHREGFGSGGWSGNDRHEDGPTDPEGTHSNKCIACNVTGWSNGGLMKVHYDESCPGCRYERSQRGFGAEGFGGVEYSNLEIATGFGMMYPVGKIAGLEEEEHKPMFISEEELAITEPVPQVAKSMFAKLRDVMRPPPSAPPATAPDNQSLPKPRQVSRRDRVLHSKERRERSRDDEQRDKHVSVVKDGKPDRKIASEDGIEITDKPFAREMPPPPYETCKPGSAAKRYSNQTRPMDPKPTKQDCMAADEVVEKKPIEEHMQPAPVSDNLQKGCRIPGKPRRYKSLWGDNVPRLTGSQSLWNACNRTRTSPTVAKASLFG